MFSPEFLQFFLSACSPSVPCFRPVSFPFSGFLLLARLQASCFLPRTRLQILHTFFLAYVLRFLPCARLQNFALSPSRASSDFALSTLRMSSKFRAFCLMPLLQGPQGGQAAKGRAAPQNAGKGNPCKWLSLNLKLSSSFILLWCARLFSVSPAVLSDPRQEPAFLSVFFLRSVRIESVPAEHVGQLRAFKDLLLVLNRRLLQFPYLFLHLSPERLVLDGA